MQEGLIWKKTLSEVTLSPANTGSATDKVLAASNNSLAYFSEADAFSVSYKSDNFTEARFLGWMVMVDVQKISPDTDDDDFYLDLYLYASQSGRAPTYDADDVAMQRIAVTAHTIVETAGLLQLPYAGAYFIKDLSAPKVRSVGDVRYYLGAAGIVTDDARAAFTAVTTMTVGLSVSAVFCEEAMYAKFGASVNKIVDEYFPEA
jgi:hypothetical protein